MGHDDDDAKLEELLELNKKQAVLGKLHNLQQIRRNEDQQESATQFRLFVLIAIASCVGWVVYNMFATSRKHPTFVKWFNDASSEAKRYPRRQIVQGSKFCVSMLQVTTTLHFPAFSNVMNLLTIWSGQIGHKGALFLLMCIEYFEKEHPPTRGKVNMLHWCGSRSQQLGTKSLASFVCRSGTRTAPLTKEELFVTWRNSAIRGNPWVDFFPSSLDDFARVPIMNELIGTYMCNEGSLRHTRLYKLFDGGLCEIANTEMTSNVTAGTVFRDYFNVNRTPTPNCDATRLDGAVNGALGMGMIAPGLVGTGILGGPAIGLLTLVGAGAGFVVGGNAAQEACENAVS